MTDPDKEMTLKEREDWLKERGVEIENPSDRTKPNGNQESTGLSIVQQVQQLSITCNNEPSEDEDSISFVYIPQDDSKPLATLRLPKEFCQTHPGDALPHYLKTFFADSKSIDTQLLKEQATKQFSGGKLQGVDVDAQNLSADALQSVTAQGSVETFCLVHPADTNQYTGVYIYLDEVGLLKNLPQNKRASQMAATCGYHPAPLFYGDVFVGRVQTQPMPMKNVAFQAPNDTSPSTAIWMQRAVSENLAWQQAMNAAAGKASGTTQPNIKGTEGEAVQEDAYAWTQNEDEIELRITNNAQDEEAFDKSQLKVVFLPKSVHVKYKGGSLVHLESLYARMDMDGCTWTLDDGGKTLVVTCEKGDPGQLWPRILLAG
jgi:hypothetical protein